MGSGKALRQKEIESIKCEVFKLDLLEQMLNFKSGKGMSAQPPMKALLVYVPHKENIFDFSPQHSTSRGHKHWSGTTSSLFQSWTATTPSIIYER